MIQLIIKSFWIIYLDFYIQSVIIFNEGPQTYVQE